MPVVSTVERVSRIVRETLDRLANDDDLVEYAVHIDVESADDDDDEARGEMNDLADKCEDCGHVHLMETVVAIFISLDCPETNSRSQSHWYVPIRNTYDDVELAQAVEETWDRVASRRMLYGLEQGLTASHDDVPAPAEGKD